MRKICDSCGKTVEYSKTCACKIGIIYNRNISEEKRKFCSSYVWQKLRNRKVKEHPYCKRCWNKYKIIIPENLQIGELEFIDEIIYIRGKEEDMSITNYFEQQWDNMTLIHPETKKEWFIQIDGNIIRSRLGTGKVLIKEVDRSSFFPPFHRAIQLVMAKLRKGFIYYNSNGKTGEAISHRFIGKVYTGFLPIATRSDGDDFYVTRVVGDFENEILVHYSGHGEVLSVKSLGSHSLTYSMSWDDEQIIYLDRVSTDDVRKVYAYNVKTGEFVSETDGNLHKINNSTIGEIENVDGIQQLIARNYRSITTKREMGFYVVEISNDNSTAPYMQIINEFSVKNSYAALTKNNLVLHSDYGVISIYKI